MDNYYKDGDFILTQDTPILADSSNPHSDVSIECKKLLISILYKLDNIDKKLDSMLSNEKTVSTELTPMEDQDRIILEYYIDSPI